MQALAPQYEKYKNMLAGGAKLTAAAPIVPMSVRLAAAGVGVLIDEDKKKAPAAFEPYKQELKELPKVAEYEEPERPDPLKGIPEKYKTPMYPKYDIPDYVKNTQGYHPGYGVMPEDIKEGRLTLSERTRAAYDRRPAYDPDDPEVPEYDPEDPGALPLALSAPFTAGIPAGFRAPGDPIPDVPVSHAFLPDLLHPEHLMPGGLGRPGAAPQPQRPPLPPSRNPLDRAARFGKFVSSRFCFHMCGFLSSLASAGQATAEAQVQKASEPPRLDTRPPVQYGEVPPGMPPGSSYGPGGMLLGPDGLPVVSPLGQPVTANDPPTGFAGGPSMRPPGVRGILHDMLDFNLNDAPWRATFAQPKPICGLVCCVPSGCCSPAVYFAFRLLETVIWGGIVMKSWDEWVTTDAPKDPGGTGHPPFSKWWTYISHQSAFINLLYFAAVTFCTGMAAFSKKPDGMGKATPWFVKGTNFLAALTPCVAVMVSIFFWGQGAAGGGLTIDFGATLLHAFNVVLVFTDFAYSRIPIYFAHAWLPPFYTMGYFWFTWIYYKAGGHNYKGEPFIYEGITDWSGEGDATRKLLMVEVAAMILTPLTFALIFMLLRCLGHTGHTYKEPAASNPGAIPDLQVLHRPRGPLRAPLKGRHLLGDGDGVKDFFENAKDNMEDFVELG